MNTAARAEVGGASAHDAFPVVASERLRLRSFALADIPTLVAIANQHGIADTVLDVPYPFTASYARGWIATHAAEWSQRRTVHWAVSRLNDDRLIGYAGLGPLDAINRQVALSVWVGRGPERRSNATEAAQAALALAFTSLGVHRVYALQIARDAFSGRVLAEIGMRQEGILRGRACKWDQFEDVVIWAQLHSEWLQSL